MNNLVEEQIKVALYRFFQMQYFEKLNNGKEKLYQLNQRELGDFFRQQRVQIEEEVIKMAFALDKISRDFGEKVADEFRRLVISASNRNKIKEGYSRSKNFYKDIFRRYRFNYVVDRLEKLFLIVLFLNLSLAKLNSN